MPGKSAPEISELLDKIVALREIILEIAAGMQVQDDRKAFVKDHLYGRIKIREILGGNFVCVTRDEHRFGIDHQTHMVESHCLDQRDIFRRRVALKMFPGVTLRVSDLVEPSAEIDTMAEMRESLRQNARLRVISGERG